MKAAIRQAAIAACWWAAASAAAQLPFFPGAEGFGGNFTGAAPSGGWFAGATIYHVTNLNDAGPGSLRGAFVENSANKIIVFDVGGTIQLTSGSLDVKNLANYYVAGQTAPSPVTIYGDTTQITHSSNKVNSNVILRYLTFRKGTGDGSDSITFAGGDGPADMVATNMILDHVSGSWSEDEILSVANNNSHVTVQYSIIADALVSGHAYGSLIRPRIDSSVTFHHNLYANNASRQARFGTYNAQTLTADFRNNVIYNWRDRASYAGGSSEAEQEFASVNYVGNYLIAGVGTTGSATRAFSVDKNVDVQLYQAGNYIDSDKGLNPGGVPNGSPAPLAAFALSTPVTDQSLTLLGAPLATAAVTTQPAPFAYDQVMNYVGNFWWAREAVDARIVNNVRSNTGPAGGIGAAAPNAAELAALLGTPLTTRGAGWDSDNDGMPDAWERKHGLNPLSAADNRLDFDADGYVNVVEYLNEAGEFPAPTPIEWTGGAGRYASILNWRTNDGGVTAGSPWQPSSYDQARIRNGTATVDAVGQRAEDLRVATQAGDVATLAVTGGWLEVAGRIVAGDEGAGTISQSGGDVVAPAVFLGGTLGGVGTYTLAGGELHVGGLHKQSVGSDFFLTGGTLNAQLVDFDFANQGGVIAPGYALGEGVGMTQFLGDLALPAGTVDLEIGGRDFGFFDRLEIDGVLTMGGTLRVRAVDAGMGLYQPALGDVIPIFASAGTSGSFAAFDLPALSPGLSWALLPGNVATFLAVVPTVPGNPADFNADGRVDAADLAVFKANYGTTLASPSQGDANGDGLVNGVDLLIWQQYEGFALVTPAAGQVPEPSVAALFVLAAAAIGRRRGAAVAP